MLIRIGYDIQFQIPTSVAMVALLSVHPSRAGDLLEPDELKTEPELKVRHYIDTFGNRCSRFVAPPGLLRLSCSTLIRHSDEPDEVNLVCSRDRYRRLAGRGAHVPVEQPLLRSGSAFRLSPVSCSEMSRRVGDGYRPSATGSTIRSPSTTSRPVPPRPRSMSTPKGYGVCRDYQHLAITFCRALNIPARYATGYLGDIGVPLRLPMDFSAWFEVYLDDRWWAFDARNNVPRLGRILMATGRDASDVAMTTSFGRADLWSFFVVSEVEEEASIAE